MSYQDNPYKAPEAAARAAASSETHSIPESVRTDMVSTGGWKRFLAILGFITSGFLFIFGIVFTAGMTSAFAALGGPGTGMSVILGLVYLLMGAFYVFPSLYLFRSGRAISDFGVSDSPSDLQKAAGNARRFWKLVGIYAIVMLALGPVMMIVGVVTAMSAY
jgi:hypothetical protein